jgi:hypothetical protein
LLKRNLSMKERPRRSKPGFQPTFRPAMGLLALAIVLGTSPSRADTSYLRPNLFTTANAGIVTVQSSFTEDFANPNVAVQSDQWQVLRPDGRRDTFDTVQAFRQVTILETDLDEPGTYRLSTGERLGRVGRQVLVEGVWTPWGPERDIPVGAQTRASQTATVADVYVTRGAPTLAALEANVGRIALRPLTHPNDVYLGQPFRLRVLLDGQPVAGQEVEIWREGGAYDEPAFNLRLTTAADGGIETTFDRPGVYLIWTRRSADAPPGSATAVRSYTTSLTLEVTR